LRFDFVIRFRGNIQVTAVSGKTHKAADWIGAGGRAVTLRDASVTGDNYRVGTVLCVHARDIKEPCCLAASSAEETLSAWPDQSLFPTMGHRIRPSRHEGSPLWNGDEINA
jgi:hypothetical protein